MFNYKNKEETKEQVCKANTMLTQFYLKVESVIFFLILLDFQGNKTLFITHLQEGIMWE